MAELTGVPETALWTLHHRATEARRPDTVLPDPRAVELADALGDELFRRFGKPTLAQWQALRAATFDRAVRAFAAEHRDGTVVALGEGLETQRWRVDDGEIDWLTVDLPEIVAERERLLPAHPRARTVTADARDLTWIDHVDPARGVLVTAQGLLMYLEPDDVHQLLDACVERVPAASIVFDAVAPWIAERSRRGELGGYRVPPWRWALDSGERRWLAGRGRLETLRPPRGRGPLFGALLPLAAVLPGVRDLLPFTIMRLTPARAPARA